MAATWQWAEIEAATRQWKAQLGPNASPFAVVIDGSLTSIGLILAAERCQQTCVLIPHTSRDELLSLLPSVAPVRSIYQPSSSGSFEQIKVDSQGDYSTWLQEAGLVKAGGGVGVFTTGTTNVPKAVVYTWSAMKLQAAETLAQVGLNQLELMTASHIAHGFAINALFVAQLARCALTVALAPTLIDTLSSFSPKYPVVFLGSPTTYALLLKNATSFPITQAYCAGAPLLKHVRQQFYQQFSVSIRQNYGTSETGNIAFVTNDDIALVKNAEAIVTDCAGSALANGVKLIAPSYRESCLLSPGFEGEICVRSPWTSLGYVNGGRFQQHDEWYHTGDMGAWFKPTDTANTRFLVVGPRLRAAIVKVDVASHLIVQLQPWQLESLLGDIPGVRELAVMQIANSYGVLIVTEGTEEEARVWCSQHLPSYALPAIIRSTRALPRSAAGKLIYPAIEQLLKKN